MYKISVIVPIFNSGELLKECLDSIVRQSIGIENIQVICVNDQSPLWSQEKEIQDYWYERYPQNFLILVNEKNIGLGMSRNRGLRCVKGEYVHFLDADDRLEPYIYLEAYHQLKKNRAQLFRTSYYRDIKIKKHYRGNASKSGIMSNADKTRALFYSYAWLNITDARLIRRMKRFPKGIYEDIPTIPTLFHAAQGRFYQSKRLGYYYRLNPSSITETWKNHIDDRDEIKLSYLWKSLLDFVDKEYFPLDYGVLIAQYFLIYMTSSSRETLDSFFHVMNTLKLWKKKTTFNTRIRLHPDSVRDYGRVADFANKILLLLWRGNFYCTLFFIRKVLIFLKKRKLIR